MIDKKYEKLVSRIEELERLIKVHESREIDLLHMYSELVKERFYRNKYLTVEEVIEKIPFELFALKIEDTFVARCVDKMYVSKLLMDDKYGKLSYAGGLNILDVYVSTTECVVILITDRE